MRNNSIKVYINTTPESHTLYAGIINNPPEGIVYKYAQPSKCPSLVQKLKSQLIYRSLFNKKILTPLLQKLDPEREQRIITRESEKWNECDVVHFCGTCFDIEKPWVVDFEHIGSFTGYCRRWDWWLTTTEFKRGMERVLSSKYCKRILPLSYAGKRTMELCLDTNKFKQKIEVLYPAIRLPELTERKNKKRTRLLFVGSINLPKEFYGKGGVEAIECFKILAEKYDVELVIRCTVPDKVRKKYAHLDGLIFKQAPLPRYELDKLYQSSDIFLSPAAHPPFMVIIEALSFGLPVVALKLWTNIELVEDGLTGFLTTPSAHVDYYSNYGVPTPATTLPRGRVDPEMVKEFASRVTILIEDGRLRREMSRNARKKVEPGGPFSISTRNKKLSRIYEEAAG